MKAMNTKKLVEAILKMEGTDNLDEALKNNPRWFGRYVKSRVRALEEGYPYGRAYGKGPFRLMSEEEAKEEEKQIEERKYTSSSLARMVGASVGIAASTIAFIYNPLGAGIGTVTEAIGSFLRVIGKYNEKDPFSDDMGGTYILGGLIGGSIGGSLGRTLITHYTNPPNDIYIPLQGLGILLGSFAIGTIGSVISNRLFGYKFLNGQRENSGF